MNKNTGKEDSYGFYYPKFIEWSRDERYLKLKSEMGLEGSGIFNELLDYLAEKDGYAASLSAIPSISFYIHTDKEKVERVINDYELFVIAEDSFYSPMLNKAMTKLDEKRQRQSEGGKAGNKKRWNKKDIGNQSESDLNDISNRSDTEQESIDTDSQPIALKESKVNKIKLNEITEEDNKEEGKREYQKKEKESISGERNHSRIVTEEDFDREFERILEENEKLLDVFDEDQACRFRIRYTNVDPSTGHPYYRSNSFNLKTKMELWRAI